MPISTDPLPADKVLKAVPDVETLELENHAQRLAQRIRLGLMSVLVLGAMISMAMEGGPRHPLFFWPASAVVLFVLAFRQHAFLLVKSTLFDQWPDRRIGLFLRTQVEEIYQEVLTPWKNEKQPPPALFISTDRSRPAFTVRNCLTSDHRFHAIYLSEDLFFWLKSGELKGVLAHELSHYHRYSGAMMRCYPLVLAILAFLPLTVLDLLKLNNPWLIALLWPLIFHLVRLILQGVQKGDAYWQEYLADAAAVKASSPLDAVNGLLLVHKRMDNLIQAYRQVLRLMKQHVWLPLSFMDDLIGELWMQLPRRIMRGQTVRKVVDDLFESAVKGVKPTPDPGPVSLVRRNRQLSRMLWQTRPLGVRRRLNWEALRGSKHAWRLDEAAYSDLIEFLLREPGRELTFFGNMAGRNEEQSHPVLRRRILFIYKNFTATV